MGLEREDQNEDLIYVCIMVVLVNHIVKVIKLFME